MSFDYFIYHTKTGKLISKDRYVAMPFLWGEASPYIHTCITKGRLDRIEQWTIDENSELWKLEISKESWDREDDVILYCSKDDILNLQKLMICNKTALEEIMVSNGSDGLIVRIF